MINSINIMFKRIGEKFPGHHLIFFSSVLTALFLMVLFNPIYSPIGDKKVEAALPAPVISFISPTIVNLSYATSSSNVTITGSIIDTNDPGVGAGSWKNNTVPAESGTLSPPAAWSITVTNLAWGLNDLEFTSTVAGDTTTVHLNVYRIPEDGELMGYAWTETIGWISLSFRNCDPDLDGFSNGLGDCPPAGSSIPRYYTQIASTTGNMSGYAWSDNVGWISFEQASTTPDSQAFNSNCFSTSCTDQSGCTACYAPGGGGASTGKLYGWANVLSLGDDGWIRLDDDNTSDGYNYGIKYNMDTNEFSGYAWSGANSAANAEAGLGWVSTNCVDDGDCNLSNYKVMGVLNMPPSATINETAAINELPCGSTGTDGACSTNCELSPVLRWDYVDPEGSPQLAYQVILKNSGGSIVADTGKVNSGLKELNLGTIYNTFTYSTQYTVELSVWDSQDLVSVSPATKTFTTDQHQYPNPLFDWFIKEGSAGEEILFTASSTYYNDSDIPSLPGVCYGFPDYPNPCLYSWTSGNANIDSPSIATTTASFPNSGVSQQMNLKVTDGDGYACSTSTQIDINKKLPSWIEVR